MQGGFATVVWVVSAAGVLGAIVGLLLNRRPWDRYGSDHLILDSEQTHTRTSTSSAVAGQHEEEIRQMLAARNARRRRRGETEIDIEQEPRRLTALTLGAELRAEARELVIARNLRRAPLGRAGARRRGRDAAPDRRAQPADQVGSHGAWQTYAAWSSTSSPIVPGPISTPRRRS